MKSQNKSIKLQTTMESVTRVHWPDYKLIGTVQESNSECFVVIEIYSSTVAPTILEKHKIYSLDTMDEFIHLQQFNYIEGVDTVIIFPPRYYKVYPVRAECEAMYRCDNFACTTGGNYHVTTSTTDFNWYQETPLFGYSRSHIFYACGNDCDDSQNNGTLTCQSKTVVEFQSILNVYGTIIESFAEIVHKAGNSVFSMKQNPLRIMSVDGTNPAKYSKYFPVVDAKLQFF